LSTGGIGGLPEIHHQDAKAEKKKDSEEVLRVRMMRVRERGRPDSPSGFVFDLMHLDPERLVQFYERFMPRLVSRID
jgi:hypothetical protein